MLECHIGVLLKFRFGEVFGILLGVKVGVPSE
jgi:hypothetical protein